MVGAEDIGLKEHVGRFDRSVDVRFGCQMRHPLGLERFHALPNGGRVTEIDLGEVVAGMVFEFGKKSRVGGVGEGVQVEDIVAGLDGPSDEVAADEAATAGDEEGGQGMGKGSGFRLRGRPPLVLAAFEPSPPRGGGEKGGVGLRGRPPLVLAALEPSPPQGGGENGGPDTYSKPRCFCSRVRK